MRKLLGLFLLVLSHAIYGQQDSLVSDREIFFVDLGLGGDFQNGFIGSLELTHQVSNTLLFSWRILSIDQTPVTETASCPTAVNTFSFSFPFSYFFRNRKWLVSLGAGPSYSEITYDPCSTIGSWDSGLGVDLVGKVWYTGKRTALGVSPFLNVNNERTFYGFTVNIGLGRFRVRK